MKFQNFLNSASFFVIICICTSLGIKAQAQIIYKTVHKDGTITYSDQASPGAIEVTLNVNTNTMQSIAATQNTPQTQSQIQVKQKSYKLNILSPEIDATVRNNAGNLSIAANLEPSLAGFYQLHINSQIIDSGTGVFKLENMDRGSYQYQVKFIGNSGKVIASSELRSLHLHRASILINP
jgi:hypothetical protein